MQKVFETLKNLFQDIIDVITGKNGQDSLAAKILGMIKSLFGAAAGEGGAE